MNQKDIGRLIAELRKEKQMTQMELANKLGVTDRAVSKWENGRGLPDLSLLSPLCDELGISLKELLSGEKANSEEKECDGKSEAGVPEQVLMGFRSQLNQEEQKKEKRKIVSWVFIAAALAAVIMVVTLSCNKTFFRETYEADFLSDVHISIPRFCFYRRTGGLDEYTTTLKTLREPDEVDVFIDEYLRTLEKIESEERVYYYDSEQDLSILSYRINNDGVGPVNTIYITYRKGRNN